LPAAGGGMKF